MATVAEDSTNDGQVATAADPTAQGTGNANAVSGPANTTEGDQDSKDEKQLPFGDGDNDDDEEEPELLEGPHGYDENCVCLHPDSGNLTFEEFYVEFRYDVDMDEAQMKEYHEGLPDHTRFYIHHEYFESSYTKGHRSNKSCYRLFRNYDYCTPQRLKQLVHERGLPDPYPAGITLKYFYVCLLDKHDQAEFSFRFMDLPPEIRVLVYEELLTLRLMPNGKRTSNPQILATCRQIFKEANTILYASNTVTARSEVEEEEDGTFKSTAIVHNDNRKSPCGHPRFARLPAGMDDFPKFLRRIRQLQIDLTYQGLEPDKVDSTYTLVFNHFIYALASFLMEVHSLRRVTINVSIGSGGDEDDHDYCATLYPLRRLRNVAHVLIEGNLPTLVRDKLVADLTSSEPVFNTLRHWKLLQEETFAQFRILRGVGEIPCECGECEPPERRQNLDLAFDAVIDAGRHSGRNRNREENFIARLSVLKRALEDTSAIAELENLIKQRLKASAATRAYELSVDAGRLREAENLWEGRVHELDLEEWEGRMSDMDLDDDHWSNDELEKAGDDFEIVGDAEKQPVVNDSRIRRALDRLASEDEEEPEDSSDDEHDGDNGSENGEANNDNGKNTVCIREDSHRGQ